MQPLNAMMPRAVMLLYPLDLALGIPDAILLGVTRGPGVHFGQPVLPCFNGVERARLADQSIWHYRRLVCHHTLVGHFLQVNGK